MVLTKYEGGKRVQLSAEEEIEVRAGWEKAEIEAASRKIEKEAVITRRKGICDKLHKLLALSEDEAAELHKMMLS